MAHSLLAHLYSRIRGSQEDVATISLQYLLSQSAELNKAFTTLIAAKLNVSLADRLQYKCQATGEEQERPDMAGCDKNGCEVVLCEMKFYAGLTENQPLGYLERLQKAGGHGLIFVCPKARQTNLWAKLKEVCAEQQVKTVNDNCISVDGIHMAIITWAEVLERLQMVAASSAIEYQSDIYQLQGYCAQMDSDAFIPFRAEDLSAEVARKEERYYTVIDETFDLLLADKALNAVLKGKTSSYSDGYERKMEINGLRIWLLYSRRLWMSDSSVETPFWVALGEIEQQDSEMYQKVAAKIPENKQDHTLYWLRYYALEPLQNAMLDEVCEDLKRQILEYVKLFREAESELK